MNRAPNLFDSLSRRRLMLGAAGAVGLASLGACGRSEATVDESGRVRLRLASGGPISALHGGFYQAIANGAYERRGLNIEILTGTAGLDVPGLLASSNVELAFGIDSFTPMALIADRAPVKAVAAFLQKDPVILISRPAANGTDLSSDNNASPIALSDLRERTLLLSLQDRQGVWHWLQSRFDLTPDRAKVGSLDEHIETMKSDPQAVLVGRLTDSEAQRVAQALGIRPQINLIANDGYPSYSSLILAPNAFARDNGPALRSFIAASVEGWRDYVHGDGSKADTLMRAANPELSQKTLDQARESLALEAMVDGADAALYGLGTMTAERWETFAAQTQGAFASAPDWRETFSLQYLPGRS